MFNSLGLLLFIVGLACAQETGAGFPHDYPGKPSGDYSPQWQTCAQSTPSPLKLGTQRFLADFQVTETLPNVTFPLNRNWAGNIAVDRPGHPNNTLFFWAFEKENGSLTATSGDRSDEPWGIWLNGG